MKLKQAMQAEHSSLMEQAISPKGVKEATHVIDEILKDGKKRWSAKLLKELVEMRALLQKGAIKRVRADLQRMMVKGKDYPADFSEDIAPKLWRILTKESDNGRS